MLEQCVDLNKWILYIQPLLAFMERVDYNWSYTGKNKAAAQGCPERDLYSRMWYGPAQRNGQEAKPRDFSCDWTVTSG